MEYEKRIIIAVEEGNVENLTKLINDYGPDWKGKRNLLVVALQKKESEVALLLLTKGWGFDITDLIIPLNLAASLDVFDSEEIIEKILERGADINSFYKGKTPLHVAIASKCFEHIEFLLNNGANVNDVCTSHGQEGYTSLHFAVMKACKYIINLLLSRGANVNAKAENGLTPLHCAIIKPNKIVVRMLLEHGANVDDQNEDGNTALYLAVKTGCLTIVKDILQYCPSIDIPSNRKSLKYTLECNHFEQTEALLRYGFPIDCEDAKNDKLLHYAVKSENTKIVEDLLKYAANVNSKAENGDTPLHVALKTGNERIVTTLLQSNANVDDVDGDGNNAICLAVRTNCLSIVKDILKYSPKIEIPNKMNPIIIAMMGSRNSKPIVDALLRYGFPENVNPEDVNSDINSTVKCKTPLHVAIEKGWLGTVEFLLNHGANVNGVCTSLSANGYISLHLAVMGGYYKIVDLLLIKGANINATAENGETALHVAADLHYRYPTYKSAKTVKLLLGKGADIHCKSRDELTPLLVAIKTSNEKVVELLLEHGANVNDQDKHGNTALNLAVETNCLSIVKNILKYCPSIDIQGNRKSLINALRRRYREDIVVALIEYGFTLNREDANNTELFHIYIWQGSSQFVELFLKSGANPNGLDSEGNTPLHTAAQNSSKEVDELLISYGADINAINNNGITVIRKAVQEKNLVLTKLLLTHGAHVEDCVQLLAAPLYDFFERKKLYESLYFYDRVRESPQEGLKLTDWQSYKHQYEELVGILQRHILQLKIANLYVNEQNLKLISQINEQLKDFAKECKEEISKMKNNQIKNTGITFFNILSNNTNILTKYMKNENIVEALKLENYKTEYPIYERMIELNFIKAMKRKELVDQTNLIFHFVFKYFYEFHKLPHCLIDKILDYLTDEDFQELLLTFKISSVNSKTNEKDCSFRRKTRNNGKRTKEYSDNFKTRCNKKKKSI